jgi:hypothetical protein
VIGDWFKLRREPGFQGEKAAWSDAFVLAAPRTLGLVLVIT